MASNNGNGSTGSTIDELVEFHLERQRWPKEVTKGIFAESAEGDLYAFSDDIPQHQSETEEDTLQHT